MNEVGSRQVAIGKFQLPNPINMFFAYFKLPTAN